MLGRMSNTVDDVREVLTEELLELLQGAKSDIEEFGAAIALDLAEAAVRGDEDLQEALTDQLRVLAEANRLDIVDSTWDIIDRVTSVALGLLIRSGVSR